MTFIKLSRFYQNFSQLDHSGITYLKSFEMLKLNEKNSDQIYKLQFMISHLKRNRPLYEGLRFVKYVPAFDIPLIKAAEESGKLVEVFKTLSKKYEETALAEKNILGQLFKPYFTLVVALFVPKFPDLFAQKITLLTYLTNSLGGLILISGTMYGFYYLWMKSYYEVEMGNLLHNILSYIPFLSRLGKKIAFEKFSSSLAMMLDSGMDLFESLKQAALCSADPEIKSSVNQFIPLIRKGVDISKVFQTGAYFPGELVNSISLGAESGKLPEFLKRYSETLKSEIDNSVKVIVKAIPTVMYIIVTAYVFMIILHFYQGHINDLNQVLDQN